MGDSKSESADDPFVDEIVNSVNEHSSLVNSSTRRGTVPATNQYISDWTEALNERFRGFDDRVISAVQAGASVPGVRDVLYAFSLACTFATAIEVATSVPVVAYALGYDAFAQWMAHVLLAATLLSQVFKRFVWRNRPFVDNRAEPLKRNYTSSFPSRAVVIAAVYAFALAYAQAEEDGDPAWSVPLLWVPLLIALTAASSFSRVFLGVHYPSDCLAGAAIGSAAVFLGAATEAWQTATCGACAVAACYGGLHPDGLWPTVTSMGDANWPLALAAFVSFSLLVWLALLPPLELWTKKSVSVFGLLLPTIAFHLAFLCPGTGLVKEPALPETSAASVPAAILHLLVAVATAAGLHGLSVPARSRSSPIWIKLLVFVAMFWVTVLVLGMFRVWVAS